MACGKDVDKCADGFVQDRSTVRPTGIVTELSTSGVKRSRSVRVLVGNVEVMRRSGSSGWSRRPPRSPSTRTPRASSSSRHHRLHHLRPHRSKTRPETRPRAAWATFHRPPRSPSTRTLRAPSSHSRWQGRHRCRRVGSWRRGKQARGRYLRTIDSMAWISLRNEASSLSFSAIFWTAEITVVWCLPPNARARSGYESLV